jgi:hypothetical protein
MSRLATWRDRISNEYRNGESRSSGMSNFARKLAGIELEASTGERVRLGRLWEKRPVVLAFIRHFG